MGAKIIKIPTAILSPGANIIRQALRVNSNGMINGYDDGLITNSYGIFKSKLIIIILGGIEL